MRWRPAHVAKQSHTCAAIRLGDVQVMASISDAITRDPCSTDIVSSRAHAVDNSGEASRAVIRGGVGRRRTILFSARVRLRESGCASPAARYTGCSRRRAQSDCVLNLLRSSLLCQTPAFYDQPNSGERGAQTCADVQVGRLVTSKTGRQGRNRLRSVRVRDARLSERSGTHPVLLRRSVKHTGVRGPISYLSRQAFHSNGRLNSRSTVSGSV
jgi:hypothetical protein